MKKNRWLLMSLSCSFVALAVSVSLFSKNPTATLGGWGTDHYSHYMEGILFFHKGFAINQQPVRTLCRPDAPEAWRTKHDCNILERSGKRPLKINWNVYARFYPPGNKAYAIIESLLYENTDIEFHTINKISIIKYLFVVHLLFFLIFIILRDAKFSSWPVFRWTIMPIVFVQLIYHSFTGFYDPISVLFVFMSIYYLQQRRDVDALLMFSLGLFLHYRSLWFLPVLIVIVWNLIRTKSHPKWTKANLVKLLSSILLLLLAAYPFSLMYANVLTIPANNPVFWRNIGWQNSLAVNYILFCLALLGYGIKKRNWIFVGVLGWQVMMFLKTPAAQSWHSLHLLPYLAFIGRRQCDNRAVDSGSDNGPVDTGTVIVLSMAYVFQLAVVFKILPFPSELLPQLISGNF